MTKRSETAKQRDKFVAHMKKAGLPTTGLMAAKPKRATEKGVEPDFRVTHKRLDGSKRVEHEHRLEQYKKPEEPTAAMQAPVVWPSLKTLELSRRLADRCNVDPTLYPAIENVEVASEMVQLAMRGEI
jgi:hypothetical protein